MNKKQIAGRYLVSVLALFATGFIIAYIVMFALSESGRATVTPAVTQRLWLSAVLALLPAGSFTGFVAAGLKLLQKDKPPKGVIIAVCVFFPITLALLTVFGIIMIIPGIVNSIAILLKKNTE